MQLTTAIQCALSQCDKVIVGLEAAKKVVEGHSMKPGQLLKIAEDAVGDGTVFFCVPGNGAYVDGKCVIFYCCSVMHGHGNALRMLSMGLIRTGNHGFFTIVLLGPAILKPAWFGRQGLMDGNLLWRKQ